MNLSRIKCPYCGEEISSTAKKCRFCNEWLPASGATGQMQQPVNPQAAPQQQAYQQTAYQQAGYMQTQQQPVYQPTAYQQAAYQQPVYQQIPCQQTPMQQPIYQVPATTDVDEDDEEDEEEEDDYDYTPSFFEAYVNWSFFSEFKDFDDFTGRKSFWLSVLSLLIINLGVTGIALLLVSLSNMASWSLTIAGILIAVWSLVLIVPSIAMGCRRLRDAGKSPMLYFLCLIPIVGPIILVVLWCQASKYDDTDYYAEFKPVDIIITAVCVVLFVAGVLTMNNSLPDMFDSTNGDDTEYYADDTDSGTYGSSETTNSTNAVPETTTHYFSGIIDGKYKIRMTLRSDGHGEYYYTKYGPNATLTLIITELAENGNIKIEEYNDKGEQTGLFDGRLDSSGEINGWFTNYKGKRMPFYLEQVNGNYQ